MKEILIYDDYNSRLLQNQDCIGTITRNVGVTAKRNGFKIIEIEGYGVQDSSESREMER